MGTFPIVDSFLDNGLRVVISEDRSAPVVALNVSYRVGSRNDRAGSLGLAHLFEHLMFQGSQRVGSGEHLSLLNRVGANGNAATGFDRTSYYETVPTSAFELALWLEADRMATCTESLTVSTLESQRNVVKNERRQRVENIPYGSSGERMFELGFPDGHHYRHMPLGSMADLDTLSLPAVQEFGATYYSPRNAVLTVVGDVSAAEALATVRRHFEGIEPGPEPPQPPYQELGPIRAELRAEFNEQVPAPALFALHRLPAFGTDELTAAELAVMMLGGNDGLAGASIHRARIAQFVEFQVVPLVAGNSVATLKFRGTGNTDTQHLQAVLDAVLDHPRFEPENLARAKARSEQGWLKTVAGFTGRAEEISRYASLLKDPYRINDVIASTDAVDMEQLWTVHHDWLGSARRVLLRYPVTHDARPS